MIRHEVSIAPSKGRSRNPDEPIGAAVKVTHPDDLRSMVQLRLTKHHYVPLLRLDLQTLHLDLFAVFPANDSSRMAVVGLASDEHQTMPVLALGSSDSCVLGAGYVDTPGVVNLRSLGFPRTTHVALRHIEFRRRDGWFLLEELGTRRGTKLVDIRRTSIGERDVAALKAIDATTLAASADPGVFEMHYTQGVSPDLINQVRFESGSEILRRDSSFLDTVMTSGFRPTTSGFMVDERVAIRWGAHSESSYSVLVEKLALHQRSHQGQVCDKEVLQLIANHVASDLVYDVKRTEALIERRTVRGVARLTLDDFYRNRTGVCRHQAAATGMIVERLVAERRLQGKVRNERRLLLHDRVWGGHQYVVFESSQPNSRPSFAPGSILVDPTVPVAEYLDNVREMSGTLDYDAPGSLVVLTPSSKLRKDFVHGALKAVETSGRHRSHSRRGIDL